jgi:rubredoxin
MDTTDPNSAPESPQSNGDSSPESVITEPKDMDRYECKACGYIYEPVKGDGRSIAPGVEFEDLPADWRCPVCSSRASAFVNLGPAGNPSGFKENLGYGLGVNTLTPGQKNILIFGALGLAVLFFLSLYGLK